MPSKLSIGCKYVRLSCVNAVMHTFRQLSILREQKPHRKQTNIMIAAIMLIIHFDVQQHRQNESDFECNKNTNTLYQVHFNKSFRIIAIFF